MKLSIVEGNGWSKTITLDKAISRVGSSPANEVRLASESVASVHLQILNAPDLPSGCRLVNFAEAVTVYNRGTVKKLQPFAFIDMYENDEVEIGEYHLTFHLPLSAGLLRKASSIEASLTFTNAVLTPDNPLEGRLTIKNIGGVNNCQCRVIVRGLDAACYQVDPIPLLYSGAQEDVRVLLFHQSTSPSAGSQDIQFVISAPDSYPGEEVALRQGIYVMPVYKQQILIQDDFHSQSSAEASASLAPAAVMPEIPVSMPVIQPSPITPAVDLPETQDSVSVPSVFPARSETLIASVPAGDAPASSSRLAPRVRSVPQRRQMRVVKESNWVETEEIIPPAQTEIPLSASTTNPPISQPQQTAGETVSEQPVIKQTGEDNQLAAQPEVESARTEIFETPPAGAAQAEKKIDEVPPAPINPASQPATTPSARPPVSNPAKVKVVRDQQDDFWDEG